jgi:tetratricopeptide (TPR) repeat protein
MPAAGVAYDLRSAGAPESPSLYSTDVTPSSTLLRANEAFDAANFVVAARLYELARGERADREYQAFIDLNVAQCRRAQGLSREAITVAKAGLMRLPDANAANAGELWLVLANSLGDLERHSEAADGYGEAVRAFGASGNVRGVAQSEVALTRSLMKLGRLSEAREILERRMEVHADEPILLSQILNNLAILHWEQGDRLRARELFRRDLEVANSIQDTAGVATTLTNLAGLESELGARDEAIVLARSAVDYARRANAVEIEARASRFLGELEVERKIVE